MGFYEDINILLSNVYDGSHCDFAMEMLTMFGGNKANAYFAEQSYGWEAKL